MFGEDLENKINTHLEKLSIGLRNSYNGLWFPRVFCFDGSRFGDDVSLESECSIDLITQSFAALYSMEFYGTKFALEDEMVISSIRSAYEILSDENSSTTALFTKPFSKSYPSPGYIQRYCKGVRENGGQYTHAAVWFSIAAMEFGEKISNDELIRIGESVAKRINPFQNLEFSKFARYRREPYVLCGDVYTADGKRGHGGWSWYTGAASWYDRLLKKLN
jgi:cyclic beta-1,2-glucan synthetase